MVSETTFRKVLVANRGEIARRVFRTLREMGIATVAVFTDADRDVPHAREADEAVRVGSYLDSEAVIAAAKTTGAEAVHPGYGFLAENARFAARCGEEGRVFIGPAPEAIRRMGDKVEARALAAEVGVPVVDGFAVAGLERDEVRRKIEALGFPALVKAAAGGGGKGMRTVRAPAELDAALDAAAREAEAAFGDGALLIERLVASPRHVEVQVLGDAHGHVVHLFERDCSLQRRHQKVFEEAPSPAVDDALRARLGEAAVALARAVDYQNAGTVEFLLEPGGSFFFLEMNTRLQVEHPVTEAVTGLDLVRLQVEIAQGRPLGFDQGDLALSGHAIEARLYAEDPTNDFLPASGTVALWAVPELPGVRVDAGVEAGDRVGVDYDPLLAKVIAHGRDRDEALRRLHRGISELAAGGLTTNRELLLAVLEHDAFRRGEVDTGFFEEHLPASARTRPRDDDVLALHAVAATLHLFHRRRQAPSPVPPGIPPGWRSRPRPQEQVFDHDAGRITVRYVARATDRLSIEVVANDRDKGDETQTRETRIAGDDRPTAEVNAEPRTRETRIVDASDGRLTIEIDGVRRRFRIGRDGAKLSVHGLGRVSELAAVPRFPERQATATAGGCAAPMTGRVVEVKVAEGDRVEAGTTLVVLEAMKMEHALEAQTDGVVASVRVRAGQMVDPDEVLVVVTPASDDRDA